MDGRNMLRRLASSAVALTIGLASTLLVTPVSVVAASVTCDYTRSDHRVKVTMTGWSDTMILRTGTGHIKVGGIWCDGVATVTNTNTILVTGDSAGQVVHLSLRNGGFRPGRTDEAGGSDEIEITLSLDGSSQDQLVVEGTSGNQWIVLGRRDTIFGTVRDINLNAGETKGIDPDVFLIGVELVNVWLFGGDDRAIGSPENGYGNVGDPIDLPLTLDGGDGHDALWGGTASDLIDAGSGNDHADGYLSPDIIDLVDGVPQNDVAYLDADDTCFGDFADYCVLR
jgi:hypothetical protein